MKNLIEKINENKWDDSTGIPTWADFEAFLEEAHGVRWVRPAAVAADIGSRRDALPQLFRKMIEAHGPD